MGFFKKSNPKKEEGTLKDVLKEFQIVQRKTQVAVKWRKRIKERVNRVCESLKQNPTNQEARTTMVKALEREKEFVDIARRGIKSGLSMLEITLKVLRKDTTMKSKIKNGMIQTIQFLIDTMQYAKGKIKVIEKRIKFGEKLESVDYQGKYFDKILKTLEDEEKIEKELGLIMEGKSKKARSALNILKYTYTDKGIIGRGAVAGFSVGALSGSLFSAGNPEEMLQTLVCGIIVSAAVTMLAFSTSTHLYEWGRRSGLGWIGSELNIQK